MENKLEFKKWLEMCGTGVVTGTHPKKVGPHSDYNIFGAPGRTGTTPKEGPIKRKKKNV